MTNGNSIKTTKYLDGFQYNKEVQSSALAGSFVKIFLKDFLTLRPPMAEGYVKATYISQSGYYKFNYVYNYTDHLGNIRLSYTKDSEGQLKVLEENHYYPFGLKHPSYALSFLIRGGNPYQYKYNGKEFQDELSLNMYAMDMRQYDPAIARWVVQDPVVHYTMSPYTAFDNNPVFWADPSGADSNDPCKSGGNCMDERGVVQLQTAIAGKRKKGYVSLTGNYRPRTKMYMENRMRNYDKGDYNHYYQLNYGKPKEYFQGTAQEHRDAYENFIYLTDVSPKIKRLNKLGRQYQWAAYIALSPFAVIAGLEVGGTTVVAKGLTDAGLQLGIKGDVDVKQTLISMYAPTLSSTAILNTGNNFLNSEIDGTRNKDFGANLLKGVTNGFGAGFGKIGILAGQEGNQVLGSMFGTQFLPGLYTNSMDAAIDYEK